MLRQAAVVCLYAILTFGMLTGAHAQQRRVALVIGNDTYENVAPLQKARNDARAMAKELEQLGFDVVKAEDLGRRAISRAVLELEKRIQPGDVALFFYAGHGFSIEGRNYLLPVDIPAPEPGEEAIVQDEAFLADELADRFRKAGASTAILVLDACRDNPFATAAKRSLAGTRGLARMSPSEGVFVLFSAGLNQAALDRLGDNDADPNSVFTRTLLEELKSPGKTIVEIAKETQEGEDARRQGRARPSAGLLRPDHRQCRAERRSRRRWQLGRILRGAVGGGAAAGSRDPFRPRQVEPNRELHALERGLDRQRVAA